jgi:hypothetical protein
VFRFFRRSQWGRQAVSPELKTAHQLYRAGKFAAAAPLYVKLGQEAEKELKPPARWLFLQAARSHLSAAEMAPAMKELEHAISLLISAGSDDKAYLIGQRFLSQLRNAGKEDEVDELAGFLHFALPGYSVSTVPQEQKTEQLLPPYCPTCEAPMRLIEVRWKDAKTAECPYCGNPVQQPVKVRG